MSQYMLTLQTNTVWAVTFVPFPFDSVDIGIFCDWCWFRL